MIKLLQTNLLCKLSFWLCFFTFYNASLYANDECADAIELIPSEGSCAYVSTSFSGATLGGNAIACASSASQDIWFKFVATDPAMRIALEGVRGVNHGFELIENSCGGNLMVCENSTATNFIDEYYMARNLVVGNTYYIRVFNASSTTTTSSFGVCVRKYPQPVNDECVNAIELIPNSTCQNVSGTFSESTLSVNNSTCSSTGAQDVWYKFTATSKMTRITLAAVSGLNHGFELREDNCTNPVFACVNNSTSAEDLQATNLVIGRTYYVRVFTTTTTITSSSFNICVRAYPAPSNDDCVDAILITPSINTTNYIQGSFSGATMTDAVPACANNSRQDVWFKFVATDAMMRIMSNEGLGINNGFELIEGSCNGTVIECVDVRSSGQIEEYYKGTFTIGETYYIRVFQSTSSLSEGTFDIGVRAYPAPINDDCNNATSIVPTIACNMVTGTLSGALFDGDNIGCAPNATQDIWYQFVATDAMMQVTLEAVSNVDLGFEIYENICTSTALACVNNGGNNSTETYLAMNFIPGNTYYVRVFTTTSFILSINVNLCVQTFPTPDNNDCENAIELVPNPTCNYTVGTMVGATLDVGTINCAPNAEQDVWYKFRATDTTMIINLDGVNGANQGFQVFENSCTGSVVICVNDYGIGVTESKTLNGLNIGTVYYIRVYNAMSGFSIDPVSICILGDAPTCTPEVNIIASATTVCDGQNVSFVATPINGGSNPTYQWMMNGVEVGSNAPVFEAINVINGSLITCFMTSDSFCAVANPTATSNRITITVRQHTSSFFASISPICIGDTFQLPNTSINGVVGTWSPAINLTETTTYTFTPDANQCAGSMQLTVTVKDPVDISYTIVENTIIATENNANYQWINCQDNSEIVGETAASFTPITSGDYAVVINKDNCIDTSDCVNILVVSVHETLNNTAIKVMPNPFQNQFTLVSHEMDLAADLIITDITGRVILEDKLQHVEQVINLENFASGLYFIRLSSRTEAIKVVKY